MTLARTAIRLGAVGILRGSAPDHPTLAGPRVFDSRMADIAPENFSEDAKPILLVTTDSDDGDALSDANGGPPFRRNIDLIVELAMVARYREGSGYVVGYPDTDARLEASLDLLEHQVIDVLANGTTDLAIAFQTKIRIWSRKSHRQTSDDTGVKIACRVLTLSCEISDDQGGPLPSATGLDRLPQPMRAICEQLPPGSSGRQACEAIAAAVQAHDRVPFEGIDWRFDAGKDDKPEHVVVGRTDFAGVAP